MTKEQIIDKACVWLKEHIWVGSPEKIGNIYFTTLLTHNRDLIDEFRKDMGEKTNPIFERCLAKVNPETRAEVRRNFDLVNSLTWEDEVINKAVNWISANACKYVKMNKEVIWTSADLNDDFRKFLGEIITKK